MNVWLNRLIKGAFLFFITFLLLQQYDDHFMVPFKDRVGETLPLLEKIDWLDNQVGREGLPILYIRWEIWCPACLSSIEKNNEIAKNFKEKLEVIGLTMQWDDAVQDFGRRVIQYPVGHDGEEIISRFFEIQAIPFYALIDKDRKVLFQGNSIDSATVKELLER